MALTSAQIQQRQSALNKGMSIAGGVLSLGTQGANMLNEAKQIQTQAPAQELDALGRPTYNLGGFSQQVDAIKPQGATGGELASGTLSGIQAGMALGPVGALVGGVVGAAGTALFGRARKKKMEKKQRLAQGNLFAAQQLFNKNMKSFNQNTAAQDFYNDQTNMDNRMYNYYSANMQA